MGILIADSGSTKTHWVFMEGEEREAFFSAGMNPYSTSPDDLRATVEQVFQGFLEGKQIDQLYFYGAGCSEPDKVNMISRALDVEGLKAVDKHIGHDLLAAARALFKQESGIACILGTGSSSALFKNDLIAEKVLSLGFLIGDEGGGMDLGKNLLIAVLKHTAPSRILDAFHAAYKMSDQEILNEIYFKPRPNRFIASFTPFLSEHLVHPFCAGIVERSFERFINLNILQYTGHRNLPVGFVGSVACAFEEVLTRLLKEKGMKPGPFMKSPMEGLVAFHSA